MVVVERISWRRAGPTNPAKDTEPHRPKSKGNRETEKLQKMTLGLP